MKRKKSTYDGILSELLATEYPFVIGCSNLFGKDGKDTWLAIPIELGDLLGLKSEFTYDSHYLIELSQEDQLIFETAIDIEFFLASDTIFGNVYERKKYKLKDYIDKRKTVLTNKTYRYEGENIKLCIPGRNF